MSSITLIPAAAGHEAKVLHHEAKSSHTMGSEKPRAALTATDQEMMYAWSIGVSGAVRAISESHHEKEECPPEVYIG